MFRAGLLLIVIIIIIIIIIIRILLCIWSNLYMFWLLAGSESNQFCHIRN